METIKKLLLWTYSRTAWQYDVLCLLILAFIFLTPQKWFANTEFTARAALRMNRPATIFLENPGGAATNLPREEIERRVRHLTNRPAAKIVNVRESKDAQGRIVAYEVDIR
jgi:hypothetical protein